MTEEITEDLSDSEILRMLLIEMREVKNRLTSLEEDRARDTKPLLGEIRKEMQEGFARVEARLANLEQESKTTRREVGLLREDIRNEGLARAELAERVDAVERRPV
jgi:serine phosphatase RsbU (regulator of sigma subunit)